MVKEDNCICGESKIKHRYSEKIGKYTYCLNIYCTCIKYIKDNNFVE